MMKVVRRKNSTRTKRIKEKKWPQEAMPNRSHRRVHVRLEKVHGKL